MIIGIIRFWQIFVIDLVGNLTGTSLTTFMLCTVELMLAGLCINIPMLRPFYIRFRAKYKSSSADKSEPQNTFGSSHTGHLAQPRQGHHTTWIELVSSDLSKIVVAAANLIASKQDNNNDTGSNDDGGSERKLRNDNDNGGITVLKNWSVRRD